VVFYLIIKEEPDRTKAVAARLNGMSFHGCNLTLLRSTWNTVHEMHDAPVEHCCGLGKPREPGHPTLTPTVAQALPVFLWGSCG